LGCRGLGYWARGRLGLGTRLASILLLITVITMAIRRKAFGNEHALVAHSLLHLGILLGKQGNPVEGESLLRECLDVTKKLPPNEHVDLEHVYFELVKVLSVEGKMDEAQKFFDEAQPFRKDLKK